MGLDGIQGKNLQASLYTANNISHANVKKATIANVEMVQTNKAENTTTRAKLEQLTKVSPAEIARAEALRSASLVNEILADLGANFKVTAGQVLSVQKGLNETTLPALNTACDFATAARVATPDGPFAELFAS